MAEAAPQAERYAAGLAGLVSALVQARQRNLRPPPKLRLSEWAERYAYLSPETSAETGRFQAFPYQIGIMDAVTDPSIRQVTVKKSARVGYTKILDHVVGYYIHQDPSPILMVQPREEDAEDYSSTEIEPMLRDTPVLADIAGDPKAKSSKQKLRKRLFRNGASVTFVGANSPGGFRRITARIILFDEVDGYPVGGAGKEGDQIKLGIKRSESFWNRKVVIGSTPTEQGSSRIDKSFQLSDQRFFLVPCPHCGMRQVLEWGGPDLPYGVKWDKDEAGQPLPETAHYVCRSGAGCVIEEADKPAMIAAGEWEASRPFKGHAGFHISALYSLFPNACWENLVTEWLEVAGDPLQRQTFVNLVLGEVYQDRGERALAEERLLARCEIYEAECPAGVAVITAGVDVQGDRVEAEVVGWGRNDESWSLDHEVFDGDPSDPELWGRVDAYLKRKWTRPDGRALPVMAACVDTGGHHTEIVYQFCRQRLGRRIWGIKGESATGGRRNPVWPTKRPTSRTKKSYRPIILGVNAAKDAIRDWLHKETFGAGYMHFPADRELNYFAQLIAERRLAKYANGQRYYVWDLPPGRANEALDCRVYAFGALRGLMHAGLKVNRRADELGCPVTPVSAEDRPPVQQLIGPIRAGVEATGAPRSTARPVELAPTGPTSPPEAATAPRPAPSSAPKPSSAPTATKASRLAARLAGMNKGLTR